MAREEVERFSGRQFDPEMVSVFMEMPDTIWEDLRKEINSQIDHFSYPIRAGSRPCCYIKSNLALRLPVYPPDEILSTEAF